MTDINDSNSNDSNSNDSNNRASGTVGENLAAALRGLAEFRVTEWDGDTLAFHFINGSADIPGWLGRDGRIILSMSGTLDVARTERFIEYLRTRIDGLPDALAADPSIAPGAGPDGPPTEDESGLDEIDALDGIVERVRTDRNAVFAPAVLMALVTLRARDLQRWHALHDQLVAAGAGERALASAMKRTRDQMTAAARGAAPARPFEMQVLQGNEKEQLDFIMGLIPPILTPVFVRDRELVRVLALKKHRLQDDPETGKPRYFEAAGIEAVNKEWLVPELAGICHFFTFKRDRDGEAVRDPVTGQPVKMTVNLPVEHVVAALQRANEVARPRLKGILQAPSMRPDGSLLTQPGYDEQTELWLIGNVALPPMPQHPTKEEGAAAIALIDELLQACFFADEQDGPLAKNRQYDRSVALAATITPTLRAAFPHCPFFGVNAPAPGSGKTYVQQIGALIATGRLAPVMSWNRNYEEFVKRLDGFQLGGMNFCIVDNANEAEIGGDELNQIATNPERLARRLGLSDMINVSNENFTLYFNGIRVRARDDLAAKVIISNLDTRTANPRLELGEHFDARPKAHDLVMADRGKYVAAALTAARAYVLAGRPGAKSWPSFDPWSRLARGQLCWYGRADVQRAAEQSIENDSSRGKLVELYDLVRTHIGIGVEFLLRQLIDKLNPAALQPHDPAREERQGDWERLCSICPTREQAPSPNALAEALGKFVRDKAAGETVNLGTPQAPELLRLVQAEKFRGVARWKLQGQGRGPGQQSFEGM